MTTKQTTGTSKSPAANVDTRIHRLLTLLTLQKNARHKQRASDLQFLIVNQTFNLVPYRHAIFWQWDGAAASVVAASGLVHLDQHGPYVLWLRQALAHIIAQNAAVFGARVVAKPGEESHAKGVALTAESYNGPDPANWAQWSSAHVLVIAMRDDAGDVRWGLWLDREDVFNPTDVAFLEDLCDGYSYALQKLEAPGSGSPLSLVMRILPSRTLLRILAVVALLGLFLPVRMSVTAPAEVVARAPKAVTAPFDGVIEKVDVEPNRSVRKGDILLTMDMTTLKNKSDLTAQELETARVALTKTEREALADPSKRTEIGILRAQIKTKETDMRYAQELLARAEVKADLDGVVMFPDANALKGRPVGTGEQVMMLANPEESELLVRVPVDAMIVLDAGQPVKFFLNVTPLSSREAKIHTSSYQATPDEDGLLSYKVRAEFIEQQDRPRVGWTGTAKLYGERTLLVFNVLRRPVIFLRRKLGL